ARALPGDLAQEVWHILARMDQRSLSAPRGIAPLSRSRRPAPGRGLTPAGLPRGRPLCVARPHTWRATHTGTASRPTLITPHEAPSRWTERWHHSRAPAPRQVTFL